IEYSNSCGIAAAPGPVRVPALKDLGLMARVAVPIRCAGQLLGYLWLIDDDETLTQQELQYACEAAAAAGQLLHRELLLGDLRHSRDRELLRDLLSEDRSVRRHAAAELTAQDRLPGNGKVVVLAVRLAAKSLGNAELASTELDAALMKAARHL